MRVVAINEARLIPARAGCPLGGGFVATQRLRATGFNPLALREKAEPAPEGPGAGLPETVHVEGDDGSGPDRRAAFECDAVVGPGEVLVPAMAARVEERDSPFPSRIGGVDARALG